MQLSKIIYKNSIYFRLQIPSGFSYPCNYQNLAIITTIKSLQYNLWNLIDMWWSFHFSFCKTNDKENRIIYNISSVRLVWLDSFKSAIFIFTYFTAFYKFCWKLFSFFFNSKKNNKFEMNIKSNTCFLFVWTEFWR